MTRKQALQQALREISNEEVRGKLNEILNDLPITNWTEQTIFDTIDQFIIDNGRIPTGTDFKIRKLPPHPVIKLRFGINLKDFLLKYYPKPKRCNSSIYFHKTKEEWKNIFLSEYKKYNPRSAEEYNSLKEKDTPGWQTIAKMYDISLWLDWLRFCKLEKHAYCNRRKKMKSELKIISHSDLKIEN